MKKIYIQSYYFLPYDFNPNLNNRKIGGGVRVLRDIGMLFYKLGFKVIFLQKSKEDFVYNFDNWAEVIGIKAPEGAKGDPIYSKKAYDIANDADVVCYGNMEDAYPYVHSNSFAIQHGIWWDYKIPLIKKLIQYERVRKVAEKVKFVLCVDTNFINWFRIVFPNSKSLSKLHYIPNYADLEKIELIEKKVSRRCLNEKILLYPRRFEKKRGYQLFLDMCNELLKRGYEFTVRIIGEGRDEEIIRNQLENMNVSYEIKKVEFDDIYLEYFNAYLTFIPTLWSEGTSLSAIESISCGAPVITSNVGGLGNIVIPNFNGLILTPTVKNFVEATARVLENEEIRNNWSKNCITLRDSFSKSNWESAVIRYYNMYFNDKLKL